MDCLSGTVDGRARWRVAGTLLLLACAVGCGPPEGTDPPASDTDSTDSEGSDSSGADSTGEMGYECTEAEVGQPLLDELFLMGESAWSDRLAIGAQSAVTFTHETSGGGTHHVDPCSQWDITPSEGITWFRHAPGIQIDIDESVPPNTTLSITVDIENGARVIQKDFITYEPVDSPVVGLWHETQRVPCDGSDPFAPLQPAELAFTTSQEIFVDWDPETLDEDYGGSFTFDPSTGALSSTLSSGSIPADFDGEGTASVAEDELRLEAIYLGSTAEPPEVEICGHVFER
ncbi:MAG: hypothetical protein AAF799_32570 [Myxococcota bacterium]